LAACDIDHRSCERSDMSTKRVRKFNTHMAEATDSDDPDLLAFAYFPMT
jgi:hypothetical protein